MTLPDDLTVFEIDFIGVWVQPEVGNNFNVITITDQDRENLPPYIPNTTEVTFNILVNLNVTPSFLPTYQMPHR